MSADGYRKINRKFDLNEVCNAVNLTLDFEERAAQVANIMFMKRFDIRTNGRSYPLPGTNKVRHEYCNETNCALDFPFDWMNKTDEELLAMYDSYWDDFDRKIKEYEDEQRRKQADEEETIAIQMNKSSQIDVSKLFKAFQDGTPIFYYTTTDQYQGRRVVLGKFIVDSIELLNERPFIVVGRNIEGAKVTFYGHVTADSAQLQPNQYPMECIIFDLGDYIQENKGTKTLVKG